MSDDIPSDRVEADERRLRELLHAVEAPAPAPLQALIAQRNAAPPSRRRLRMPALAFGGAFATAAAAAAVLAVLVAGGTSAPTALRAARLALAQPRASAPARVVATGTDIAFPDWSRTGWPRTGLRRDSLGGRAVTTEFYGSGASSIGYSIVSGAPLRVGSGGQTVQRSRAEYRLLRSDGANVVAWVQQGHTCIVASRTAPASTLLRLAVEQDGGAATVSDPVGWDGSQDLSARA